MTGKTVGGERERERQRERERERERDRDRQREREKGGRKREWEVDESERPGAVPWRSHVAALPLSAPPFYASLLALVLHVSLHNTPCRV